jgi:hypothetical protein
MTKFEDGSKLSLMQIDGFIAWYSSWLFALLLGQTF